jgi:hypothetical protein
LQTGHVMLYVCNFSSCNDSWDEMTVSRLKYNSTSLKVFVYKNMSRTDRRAYCPVMSSFYYRSKKRSFPEKKYNSQRLWSVYPYYRSFCKLRISFCSTTLTAWLWFFSTCCTRNKMATTLFQCRDRMVRFSFGNYLLFSFTKQFYTKIEETKNYGVLRS